MTRERGFWPLEAASDGGRASGSATGRRLRRVALTGGIATGKSYVRARLAHLGVPTVDADVLAREVVAPGTPGFAAVVARFGAAVVGSDGALDRRALGSIVFADADARRDLEEIVHPLVRDRTERWFAGIDPAVHPWALADIPLLFETGRYRDFDAIVVVACDPETQVRRLMARDRLAEPDARRRLAAQLPIGDKVQRADYVVNTDGTFEDTDRQVDAVYRTLSRS